MNTVRTLLATALLSASAFAIAQSGNHTLMSVQIPFAFQVNGKGMPGGHYRVDRVGIENLLSLHEIEGQHGTLLLANPDPYVRNENESSLIFLRTGTEYRLTRVKCGYGALSFNVPQSKRRRVAEGPAETATLIADPQ